MGSGDTAAWCWAVRGALARRSLATFLEFLREGPGTANPACGDGAGGRVGHDGPAARGRPLGIAWIPFVRSGGDLAEPVTGARVRDAGTRPWHGAP